VAKKIKQEELAPFTVYLLRAKTQYSSLRFPSVPF
jgi:hypothetical protein